MGFDYITWITVATYIFGALGIGYLLLSITTWRGPSPLMRFLGRLCGGLFLLCMGATDFAPIILSPRLTTTGEVSGFRQVHAGRAYYYFEFFVSKPASAAPVRVHADYSDKEFNLGDPAVSDGDIVEVTYLRDTEEAASIREIRGSHPGWYYKADLIPVGLPIFSIAGLVVIAFAMGGLITDIQAKSGEPSENRHDSILGL